MNCCKYVSPLTYILSSSIHFPHTHIISTSNRSLPSASLQKYITLTKLCTTYDISPGEEFNPNSEFIFVQILPIHFTFPSFFKISISTNIPYILMQSITVVFRMPNRFNEITVSWDSLTVCDLASVELQVTSVFNKPNRNSSNYWLFTRSARAGVFIVCTVISCMHTLH